MSESKEETQIVPVKGEVKVPASGGDLDTDAPKLVESKLKERNEDLTRQTTIRNELAGIAEHSDPQQQSKSEISEDSPIKTFEEMLDASGGNWEQKFARWWMKSKISPEMTIKMLKAIGIDKFQKWIMKFAKKEDGSLPVNYTLEDSSVASMLDAATNKTFINEMYHVIGSGVGGTAFTAIVLALSPLYPPGMILPVILFGNSVIFGVNTPFVLAQRYSRARLTLAINKALAAGRPFDKTRYKNFLGIQLPKN